MLFVNGVKKMLLVIADHLPAPDPEWGIKHSYKICVRGFLLRLFGILSKIIAQNPNRAEPWLDPPLDWSAQFPRVEFRGWGIYKSPGSVISR